MLNAVACIVCRPAAGAYRDFNRFALQFRFRVCDFNLNSNLKCVVFCYFFFFFFFINKLVIVCLKCAGWMTSAFGNLMAIECVHIALQSRVHTYACSLSSLTVLHLFAHTDSSSISIPHPHLIIVVYGAKIELKPKKYWSGGYVLITLQFSPIRVANPGSKPIEYQHIAQMAYACECLCARIASICKLWI